MHGDSAARCGVPVLGCVVYQSVKSLGIQVLSAVSLALGCIGAGGSVPKLLDFHAYKVQACIQYMKIYRMDYRDFRLLFI